MIHIDDAGSGSLIGGTCIGIMRIETKEYYFDIIPLKYYNTINFPQKKYLDYVIKIAKDAFNVLNINKNEPIQICRGYMFDKLRIWFDENGYTWTSIEITGLLQTAVENTFEEYTISLGFPYEYITYTKYPFHFHRILRWVYADYKVRLKLCKVGWKSWQRYGKLAVETEYRKMPNKQYTCLKCGELLVPHDVVKVLLFKSNKPNIIYLHPEC